MSGTSQPNELKEHEANSIAIGACIPLGFLFCEEQQKASRAQHMEQQLSDPEIFYVMWNIFGLDHCSVRPHLSDEERSELDAFLEAFHGLNWHPIPKRPNVYTLDKDESLDSLRVSGRKLHDILIARQLGSR